MQNTGTELEALTVPTQKQVRLSWQIALSSLTLLLLILLTSCGESAGGDGSQSKDTASTSADSTSWILTPAHYDTLSPNPAPLTGGKSSIEELVEAGLKGLKEKDTVTLLALMVTPEEYSTIIYPELGKYWSGARDRRETIAEWLRTNHFGSAEKGLRRSLRDFGGASFKLQNVTFQDSTQNYPSFTIHQQMLVSVADQDNKQRELKIFGSVVEKDGVFKLLSWREGES